MYYNSTTLINNHPTLLHCPTENRYSPDLSLVPPSIASKRTWQILPDLGYNHLPISIAISTPITNLTSRSCSFNLLHFQTLRTNGSRKTYLFSRLQQYPLIRASWPGRSAVDQILLLSQSIADSFHQSKPGARTVLTTLNSVDFAKAFDSVWHSAFLSKLLYFGLPLCFDKWIQPYLPDRRSKVQIYYFHSRPSVLIEVSTKVQFLDEYFSLFLSMISSSLRSAVKVSLYANNLAIWTSSPNVECATAAVQIALNRLVEWSCKLCLPLSPLK